MSLKERIISDLTASMKARDAAQTSTLRMVKAALMNREIDKGSALSDEETRALLGSLVKQRRDSVEEYEKAGRPELAAKEQSEIAVIETYLPRPATRAEVAAAVEEAAREVGATSLREMGAVMKNVQVRLADRTLDNRLVSEIVKARLQGGAPG